jgi:hypothetical protein
VRSLNSGRGYNGVAALDRGESAHGAGALESGGGKVEFRGGITRRREDTPLPGLGSRHLTSRYRAFKLNRLIYLFVRHLLALDVFHGMVGNLAGLGENLHRAALCYCRELRGLVASECTFWLITLSCASGIIGQSCESGTMGRYVSSGNGTPPWCA